MFVDALIDVGLSLTNSRKQLIASIFNCQVRGEIVLMSVFKFFVMQSVYSWYSNENEIDHNLPMVGHLESTFIYLLKLAEDNNLDMAKLINFSNEVGMSIFHRAAKWSISCTSELLKRNVNVNRITENFETAQLKVFKFLKRDFLNKFLKFPLLRQEIVRRGLNPYIQAINPNNHIYTQFDMWPEISNLKKLPLVKSVFFSIKNFDVGNLGRPWHYTTGVYEGCFESILGRGSDGIVIKGKFCGRPVAYKFVQYKIFREREHQMKRGSDELFDEMNKRLQEMVEMQSTPGSSIMKTIAHFRSEKILFI